MKSALVLFIILLSVERAEMMKHVKGFHFHEELKEYWPIPKEEMEKHEKDESSTWMYNFQNDSHCARIDVEPFILPRNISFCFKINNDIVATEVGSPS